MGEQGTRRHARAEIAARYPLLTRVGFLSAWFLGPLAAFRGIQLGWTDGNWGSDSHAYWLTRTGELAYDRVPGQADAFLYSPAFADAVWPLTQTPWPVFVTTWMLIELAALVWLLWPLQLRWSIPLGMLCVPELVNGNTYILLAAVAVGGLRWPALWAFPVLTKVLPGVGALWFAVRGEWRRFGIAVGATLAIGAASYLLHPGEWHRWVAFLLDNREGTRESSGVFVGRLLLALVLVVYGARRDRPWVLAVVGMLASPALAPTTATVLIALPRLMGMTEPDETA